MHLLICIWQSAPRLTTDKQHSSRGRRLIFGNTGIHPRCCYPHTLPSDEPKKAWNLRRYISNLDSCQGISFEASRDKGQPSPGAGRQGSSTFCMCSWPRGDLHSLPHLLLNTEEFAHPVTMETLTLPVAKQQLQTPSPKRNTFIGKNS